MSTGADWFVYLAVTAIFTFGAVVMFLSVTDRDPGTLAQD